MPPPPARRRTAAEQILVDYITQIAPMTDAEIEAILGLIKVREHQKGAILLREGQIGATCYFVMQGCIRQFQMIDGLEKTTAFFTEGMPVTSTSSFENEPSKFFLVCNEDCIVVEGTEADEANFFEKLPRMETLSRIGVEKELQKTQASLSEFIVSSPENRYLNLLETRPELLDRVPQYQLASFLGVTPESLSRIRKRIMSR